MVKASSHKIQIFLIKKAKYQRKWKKEEDDELIRLAKKHKEKNWKEIASCFVNKKALQCFSRYKRIRPGIKKGSWKKEEDEIIIELVKKYNMSWSKISKEVKSRNGKQIRDRYLNVLDPTIDKSKFTEEDDQMILKLHLGNGPKWGLISTFFHRRTADMIKNRFHSSIKKRYLSDHTLKPLFPYNINGHIHGLEGRGGDANALSSLNRTHQVFQEDKNETKEFTGVFDTDFFGRDTRYENNFGNNWSYLDSMTE